MDEFQLEKFKRLFNELLQEGYGEIIWRIVIKKGKVEYISLTKSNVFKIDTNLKKVYPNYNG